MAFPISSWLFNLVGYETRCDQVVNAARSTCSKCTTKYDELAGTSMNKNYTHADITRDGSRQTVCYGFCKYSLSCQCWKCMYCESVGHHKTNCRVAYEHAHTHSCSHTNSIKQTSRYASFVKESDELKQLALLEEVENAKWVATLEKEKNMRADLEKDIACIEKQIVADTWELHKLKSEDIAAIWDRPAPPDRIRVAARRTLEDGIRISSAIVNNARAQLAMRRVQWDRYELTLRESQRSRRAAVRNKYINLFIN